MRGKERFLLVGLTLVIILVGIIGTCAVWGSPGTAKLNIWVSAMDDPCKVSSRTWYITIFDCDGKVLEWCGKRYVVLPARHGHLEVKVPPGSYYIKGVWGYRQVIPGRVYWVNHFTDVAIAEACCETTTCVKLFNPSAHRCGYIFLRALNDLLEQRAIKPEVAKRTMNAINETLRELPRPVKEFELGIEAEIEKLLKEQ